MVHTRFVFVSFVFNLAESGFAVAQIVGDEKGFISRYAVEAPVQKQPEAPSLPPVTRASNSAVMADQRVAAVAAPQQAPMGPAAVAYDATQCKTMQELESWRDQVLDHIKKFVPKPYQDFASKSIESKYEDRKAQLSSTKSASSPIAPHISSAAPSSEVLVARPALAPNAEMNQMGQPQSAGLDLRHMLEDVVSCKTEADLEAWRSKVRLFVDQELPQEFKPLALGDMQRHYEIRLGELRKVNTVSDGQMLSQMLADVDRCESEPELVIWREHVASHIRSNLPSRIQIPALGDMQMRFDRRLEMIQKSRSNSQIDASAVPSTAGISDGVSSATSFGTFTLVLGGLTLPAFMAVFAAFVRARHKAVVPTVCDIDCETHLLQA